MRFILTIGQSLRIKGQRIANAALSLILLSAVAVAVVSVFGSEVLGAWKTTESAEQALASSSTFEGLLNFEVPAESVARLNVQRQEVQQHSKAEARLAAVMENWKNTGIISTLVQLFQVKIAGYINKPFATYTPDPFGGLTPSTFTPDPFTGNIHSPAQVAAYNDLQGIKLLNDKLGDIAQQKVYGVDEATGYLLITAWNTSLAAAGVTAINTIAASAIASALAIPFIGPILAGTIFGLAASADIYIAAKLYAINNSNLAAVLAATANSNNVLNAHLAADVFNPLQPATPYQ